MSPRILVTCSRTWRRWSQAREVLTSIHARYPGAVLVHGDCPDGDRQLAGIWRGLGGKDEPWPADWRTYGTGAGPIRNALMVESNPDLVVAFIRNQSAGATHCYELAVGAGLNVVPAYREDDNA
jgi:hypothetical protein